MSDNRVFIQENKNFRELILKDQSFLNEHVLVDGVWVYDSLIALGTLRGGVLFVNPQTGATVQVVDYLSGLPDNEVYALMTDRRQGVWVAHEYGFTRIAPNIPFRSFNHFEGLAGNLMCAQSYHGKVFVGTTLGLFQLTEDTPVPKIIPAKEIKSAKGKKGSNKKKNAPIEVEVKKDSIPVTVNFIYKKVAGIEGKVMQLTVVNGKLIASG
jgi:ligand-binding sensor domain-containing protein